MDTARVLADYGSRLRVSREAVRGPAAARNRGLAQASGEVVAPGRVLKGDGTPYRVYTPYHRAWAAHGWRAPAPSEDADVAWVPASQ